MPERCQDDAKKIWRVGSNFYVQKIPIYKKFRKLRVRSQFLADPDASCIMSNEMNLGGKIHRLQEPFLDVPAKAY